MTLAEFLTWEPAQPLRYEFAGSEVFAMAGASRAHGSIVTNLIALLHAATRERGCGLYAAAMKVAIAGAASVRYPDVVVTRDRRDLDDEQITRFPSLLIEVVSRLTDALDRGAKFAEDREIPSLAAFVLVDSRIVHVEAFRRRDGKRWLFEEYGPGDSIVLESIGCHIEVDAVYDTLRLSRSARIVE